MIDRHRFYDIVRGSLASLSQSQVDGINDILDEWELLQSISDQRQLAYILGTVYHETAGSMQPVKEHGGESYLKSKNYYPYYGRDLVQTTWLRNYEKVKKFSDIDVVNNPDLIGQMPLAAKVAIHFMVNGLYTGKKLSDYFNQASGDWRNARRIINGTDRADLVASYAKKFYSALS